LHQGRFGGRTTVGAAPRRAAGALEAAVLAVLWEAGEPLSPADVRERLDARAGTGADDAHAGDPRVGAGPDGLAYTTVVTILTRLFEKNALSRERDGRAFRYAPVADAAGLAARRLTAVLDTAADRNAVLTRFVEDLPDHEEQLLRELLDARPQSDARPQPPAPDAD
jgi:predicted transcriptional regulator